MFNKELLQAINDWQIGAGPSGKATKAQALLALSANLPERLKSYSSMCYRQIAIPAGSLWKLIIDSDLPETISAWTKSPDVAKAIKGGVGDAHSGFQFAIIEHKPAPGEVVIDLDCLYRDPEFMVAVEALKGDIFRFGDGIGRYGNSQEEILLQVTTVGVTQIYSLGGRSAQLQAAMKDMLGDNPSSETLCAIDKQFHQVGVSEGAWWLNTEMTYNALSRSLDHVDALFDRIGVARIQSK